MCLFAPINLITYLYPYGLMCIYVILCVIISNYVLSLLFLQVFQLSPLGAFSVWPLCPGDMPHPLSYKHILAFFRLILCSPRLSSESPISSRGPGSFYLMVVETKTWALGVVTASRLLSGCVCTLVRVHTRVCS